MLTSSVRLLFFMILFPFAVFSKETNLHPGYYIDQQGDTVKCDIELATWNKNPFVVHISDSQRSLDLRPEDTKGFGVFGFADYVSANVTYHTERITGTDLPDSYSDKVETKWCFLKLIASGVVKLYELQADHRTIFFISDHGSDPTELLYRVALKDGQITEDQHYKQVLLRLFNKQGIDENYERRIERISYKENDLLSLVKKLNKSAGKSYAKEAIGDFDYVVFAGAQSYLFPSSFNGFYSVNDKFSNTLSPLIGLGLFYDLTPYSGRFKLGLSADYSTYNLSQNKSGIIGNFYSQNFYDTITYSEHLHWSNTFVTLKLFLVYVLNPDSKAKFYLKGGVWYSFSIKKNPDIYCDYTSTSLTSYNGLPPVPGMQMGRQTLLTVSKSFGSIVTGTGIKIGKSQVEVNYSVSSYTGRFDGSGNKFKIGAVSLTYGYVFGKHK